ncbi:hypothetical protein VNI00_006439 [Paramarasmius palmivorus]|uniref:Uncharacterized protein n=1 Tax=Paramarasmius palmivorus TaxID=297713 RepID=A0AAW0D8V3_9AGAR
MVSSSPQRRSPRKSQPSPRRLDLEKSKKQRAPRLCQKCGGKTLQKDCPLHSASARKGRQKTKKDSVTNVQSPPVPVSMPNSTPDDHLPPTPTLDDRESELLEVPSGDQRDSEPASSSFPAASHAQPFALDPALENETGTPVRPAALDPVVPPSASSSTTSGAAFFRSGLYTADSSPLSRTIASRGSSPFTPQHPRRLFTMDGNSISAPRGMTAAETLPSPSNTPTPSSSVGSASQPRPRIRVSRSNAPFGFVHGAFKGAETWQIPRVRARKKPLTKGSVQKRFDEKLSGIVNRCEELCDETGAYLMITSQLPSARHGFVNYVSKPFRDEAAQSLDQLYDLTEDIYTSLIAARRRDVASAEYQAAKARREAEEARSAVANALADLDALSQRQEQQTRVLRGLRCALSEAGQDNLLSMLDGLVPNTDLQLPNTQ